ncbi:MAG: hypothetical protein KKF48_02100 [Nanoarchaeota archaeon]|nr:hypothetical protein [Nanoarchaeota archaeon]MBU1027812.1 hypothetical protein [Nanoarchaeota archaeon]
MNLGEIFKKRGAKELIKAFREAEKEIEKNSELALKYLNKAQRLYDRLDYPTKKFENRLYRLRRMYGEKQASSSRKF